MSKAQSTASAAVPRVVAGTMIPSKWKVSTPAERLETEKLRSEQFQIWRSHRAYRSTITHHFLEEVHAHFRESFTALLRQAEQLEQQQQQQQQKTVNLPAFQRILRGLEHHHSLEDNMFFPQMKSALPELADGFEYLSRDHRALHPLEEQVKSIGSASALREFVSFLFDHLNREEMLIVPYMLEATNGMMF